MHLLAGRLVYAAKLTCLLPNVHHFVLRQQTSELYIVEGTGCYHNARNRCGRTGFSHIDDHQHAGAIGRGAIHRDQFAASRFNQFFGRLVATDCRIVHDTVESDADGKFEGRFENARTALIKTRRAGRPPPAAAEPRPSNMIDLMEAPGELSGLAHDPEM